MKLTLIARTYKNVLEGELYARTSNSMNVLCSVGISSFSVSTWILNKDAWGLLSIWISIPLSKLLKALAKYRRGATAVSSKFSINLSKSFGFLISKHSRVFRKYSRQHDTMRYVMLLRHVEDKSCGLSQFLEMGWRNHPPQSNALGTQFPPKLPHINISICRNPLLSNQRYKTVTENMSFLRRICIKNLIIVLRVVYRLVIWFCNWSLCSVFLPNHIFASNSYKLRSNKNL